MIGGLDFVGVPCRDAEAARSFYVETLGLRPDASARFEFWVGETCFGLCGPGRLGRPAAAQKNAPAVMTGYRAPDPAPTRPGNAVGKGAPACCA